MQHALHCSFIIRECCCACTSTRCWRSAQPCPCTPRFGRYPSPTLKPRTWPKLFQMSVMIAHKECNEEGSSFLIVVHRTVYIYLTCEWLTVSIIGTCCYTAWCLSLVADVGAEYTNNIKSRIRPRGKFDCTVYPVPLTRVAGTFLTHAPMRSRVSGGP